jgi:hypothetical protein
LKKFDAGRRIAGSLQKVFHVESDGLAVGAIAWGAVVNKTVGAIPLNRTTSWHIAPVSYFGFGQVNGHPVLCESSYSSVGNSTVDFDQLKGCRFKAATGRARQHKGVAHHHQHPFAHGAGGNNASLAKSVDAFCLRLAHQRPQAQNQGDATLGKPFRRHCVIPLPLVGRPVLCLMVAR